MVPEELAELPLPSAEALDRLVYVAGTPRGGTTVMFNCLGMHPRVLALPENSHFMNHVWRYRRRIHRRLLKIIFGLPRYYDEKKVRGVLDERQVAGLTRHINGVFARRNLDELYQLYPIMYALSGESGRDPAELHCWADKMTNSYGMRTIARRMPQAKFVLLVRDPRASVASLARRSMRQRGDTGPQLDPSTVWAEAISWRRIVQDLLRFARQAGARAQIVRFEDFAADPASELNRLYAFITGEPMSADDLEAALRSVEYWTSNDPADRGSGINPDAIDRWRHTLEPSVRALIEALTWRTAEKLGYDVPRAGLKDILGAWRAARGGRRRLIFAIKLIYLACRENVTPRPQPILGRAPAGAQSKGRDTVAPNQAA